MQGLFWVERVLEGDSAEIAVDGVGAGERRVRIEMSRAEAAEIRPGTVLVVEWWSAELPTKGVETGLRPTVPEAGAEAGAEAGPGAELFDDASDASLRRGESAEQEFRALLGLD